MIKNVPLRLVLGFAVAIGAGFGISSQSAFAQDAEAEKPIPVWEKRCLKREGTETTFCETSYGYFVTTDDTKRWIANSGIQEVSGEPQKDLFFFVPLGVRLSPGLGFRIDEGEPKTAAYSACLPRGCQAVIRIDDTVIAAMKKGNQLRVQFQDAAGKAVPGWVTLAGFTAAYEGAPTDVKTVPAPAPQAAAPQPPAAPDQSGKGDAPVQ